MSSPLVISLKGVQVTAVNYISVTSLLSNTCYINACIPSQLEALPLQVPELTHVLTTDPPLSPNPERHMYIALVPASNGHSVSGPNPIYPFSGVERPGHDMAAWNQVARVKFNLMQGLYVYAMIVGSMQHVRQFHT